MSSLFRGSLLEACLVQIYIDFRLDLASLDA